MKIESGDRVWFFHNDKEHSGYVRFVKGETLEISVYYIDGVALGCYKIMSDITIGAIIRFEKRKEKRND